MISKNKWRICFERNSTGRHFVEYREAASFADAAREAHLIRATMSLDCSIRSVSISEMGQPPEIMQTPALPHNERLKRKQQTNGE